MKIQTLCNQYLLTLCNTSPSRIEYCIHFRPGITLDVIVHNAGGINGTRDIKDGGAMFAEQKLENISAERMLAAFQLNTLGVLRVQQALLPNMKSPGGKIAVISTGMGSIADASGGLYAYRCSKAAVNMVAKLMSGDLKDRGIAVVAANPGMVMNNIISANIICHNHNVNETYYTKYKDHIDEWRWSWRLIREW
jgi:NAD(P)-dependent dehydrogenase (short-subunit alcohol dehydrogenase family)